MNDLITVLGEIFIFNYRKKLKLIKLNEKKNFVLVIV